MKALFVGGPLHGQVREESDGGGFNLWTFSEHGMGSVFYARHKLMWSLPGTDMKRMVVMAIGNDAPDWLQVLDAMAVALDLQQEAP